MVKKIRDWFNENEEKYEKMVKSIERRQGAVLADFLQDKEIYATSSVPESFTSRQDQKDIVILDTASTSHVFHQRSRFIEYNLLENPTEVRTGDSQCYVIGVGSIRLTVNTDKGMRVIRIENVQHIPDFHVNIIAYKAFKAKGVYLDGKKNWLRREKDEKCVAICKESPCRSFLVLEGEASRQTKHESQATRSNQQQVVGNCDIRDSLSPQSNPVMFATISQLSVYLV